MNVLAKYFLVSLVVIQLTDQRDSNKISISIGSHKNYSDPLDKNRITKRIDVEFGEFPYMVSVQKYFAPFGSHVCGGTLVKSNWILTAAHCVVNRSNCTKKRAEKFRVVAGTTNLKELFVASTSLVTRIFVHPEFNCLFFPNDVALMLLTNPVGKHLTKLAKQKMFIDNRLLRYYHQNCVALSWENFEFSQKLQKVLFPRLYYNACKSRLDDKQICTYRHEQSACKRDSGEALFCDKVQVGIACDIIPDDCADGAACWTRIDFFDSWIYETIKNKCGGADLIFKYIFILHSLIFFCEKDL